MSKPTFVEQCLNGEALADDIFTHIGEWHESDTVESLAEFLGFTPEEYALRVEQPTSLDLIFQARNTKSPLQEMQTGTEKVSGTNT